jgi:hypothetical protein
MANRLISLAFSALEASRATAGATVGRQLDPGGAL